MAVKLHFSVFLSLSVQHSSSPPFKRELPCLAVNLHRKGFGVLGTARQDTIMIAALISFGLVMAFGAYISGQLFRNRVLQQDAVRVAEVWRERAETNAGKQTSLLQTFHSEAQR